MLVDNVCKLFFVDTFIAAVAGCKLSEFMMAKHTWSQEQYDEYLNVYRVHFYNIHTKIENLV